MSRVSKDIFYTMDKSYKTVRRPFVCVECDSRSSLIFPLTTPAKLNVALEVCSDCAYIRNYEDPTKITEFPLTQFIYAAELVVHLTEEQVQLYRTHSDIVPICRVCENYLKMIGGKCTPVGCISPRFVGKVEK